MQFMRNEFNPQGFSKAKKTQHRRTTAYLARTKEERKYLQYLENLGGDRGIQRYSLVEKLKIRMGGKHAAEVYRREEMEMECLDLPYWKMSGG